MRPIEALQQCGQFVLLRHVPGASLVEGVLNDSLDEVRADVVVQVHAFDIRRGGEWPTYNSSRRGEGDHPMGHSPAHEHGACCSEYSTRLVNFYCSAVQCSLLFFKPTAPPPGPASGIPPGAGGAAATWPGRADKIIKKRR